MKHTPTPWKAVTTYGAITSDGKTVAMVDNHYKPTLERGFPDSKEEREANAAFIVHAVNTIDALEKSHTELLHALGRIVPECAALDHVNDEDFHRCDQQCPVEKLIREAIANAQPVVTMLREVK